jgi:hypothetical protein
MPTRGVSLQPGLWGVVGHLTALLMNYISELVNDGKKEGQENGRERLKLNCAEKFDGK